MSHFEKIKKKAIYMVGEHPVDRFCSDRFYPTFPKSRAQEYLIKKVNEGTIFHEFDSKDGFARHIKNGDMYFPCVMAYETDNHQYFIVKTLLTWDMLVESVISKLG